MVARPYPPTLAAWLTSDDAPLRPLRPATLAVTAGRPPHEPDEPLNAPVTLASTYVAGGDVEYGRYGNPTWTAFEEALGALEGGRCLAFASGLAAVATLLDLVGNDAVVVAPRHSYNGTVMQLADLEARGRIKVRLVDVTDQRGAGRGLRGRRPGVAGVADQPGPGGHRPGAGDRRRPRRRRLRRRRQHLRHSPAAAAADARRRPGRALGDEVHRRPQRRPHGRGRHPLRRAVRRAEEAARPASATRRARSRRGWRCAGCARSRCGWSGRRRTPPSSPRRLADHPAVAEVRYPGFGGDRGDGDRAGRAGRRPGHPLDAAVGARHQPRRGGVAARAAAAVEDRAGDDPRRAGAALGRHRGRRGPVGRPVPGARPGARRAGRVGHERHQDQRDHRRPRQRRRARPPLRRRAGAVDDQDGFEGFELLKPTDDRTSGWSSPGGATRRPSRPGSAPRVQRRAPPGPERRHGGQGAAPGGR